MSPLVIAQFAVSVVLQVVALAMLPMTRGFTRPLPAIAVGGMFVVAIGLYARLVAGGVPLSVLVPMSSAT